MRGRQRVLREILKKHRPDLDEEKRAMLLERTDAIECLGIQIWRTVEQMNETEKVFYLGSLVEEQRVMRYQSWLARTPKDV